jgi:hypothetical protein
MNQDVTRTHWAWPLTGIGFAIAAGSGILFSTILAPEPYPSPFGAPLGPQTDIARYFTEARPQVELMAFAYTIGALLLVCFIACLWSAIRSRSEEDGPWPALTLGAGLLAAAFWQLTALLLWVLARPWTPDQPNLLRAVHDLTYLTGGPAHVLMFGLFVGGASVGLSRDAMFPVALIWIGKVAAALSLLSILALLFEPATLLLPIGRGLGLLWTVGAGGLLAWRGGQPRRVAFGQTARSPS